MAKAIEELGTYVTPQIVTRDDNVVFQSEWDNLNKIKTNVTGSNVVNNAAGIMLQVRKQGRQEEQGEEFTHSCTRSFCTSYIRAFKGCENISSARKRVSTRDMCEQTFLSR